MNRCDQCKHEARWKCFSCPQFLCQTHIRAHLIKEPSHNCIRLKQLRSYDSHAQEDRVKYEAALVIISNNSQPTIPTKDPNLDLTQSSQDIFSIFGSCCVDSVSSDSNHLKAYYEKEKSQRTRPCVWNGCQAEEFIRKKYGLFIQGHISYVKSLAISCDNKYIVTGSSDKTIRVWDTEKRQQVAVLFGHKSWVTYVLITSDNKYIVSASDDKTVRVWNFIEQESVFEGHTSDVEGIAMTSDNHYIVSASADKTLKIWNLRKRYLEATLKGHTDRVRCVVLTSQNKYIVSGSDDTSIRVWNLIKKKLVAVLKGHTSPIKKLFIIKNDTYIVSRAARKIILSWNIKKRQREPIPNNTIDWRWITVVSRDQVYALSLSVIKIELWDLHRQEMQEVLVERSSERIKKISLSNDKMLVAAASMKSSIHFFRVQPMSEIVSFASHTRWITEVTFLGDKKHVVPCTLEENDIKIWCLKKQKEKAILKGHTGKVLVIKITNDNKYLVSGSEDNTIRIWDIKKTRTIAVLKGHNRSVYYLTITSDDKYIISGAIYDNIRVWNLQERRIMRIICIKNDYLQSVAVTISNKFIVAATFYQVKVFIW